MSSDIRNPTFFDQLGEDSENDENSNDDACDDVNDYQSDEETVFSTQTIDSSNLTDIYGNTVEGATDEDEDEAVEEGGQSEPSDSEIAANNAINNTSTNTSNDDPEGESIPIPSGRSIAHHHIADNKAVILSLDIETAGEYVGIVQLSCEIVRFTLVPGRKVNNDTIANVTRVSTNWPRKIGLRRNWSSCGFLAASAMAKPPRLWIFRNQQLTAIGHLPRRDL